MKQDRGGGIGCRVHITEMTLTSRYLPMNPPDSVEMPLNSFQHTSNSMKLRLLRMSYK